jgi:hypothetical protein
MGIGCCIAPQLLARSHASVTPEFPIAALREAATAILPQQADSDRFAAKIGIDDH